MSRKNELVLRNEIAKTMALLYQRGMITPTGGNISARPPGADYFWITPSGLFKANLKGSGLVKVNLDGETTRQRSRPSTETPLHTSIYLARGDVNAIIHAHSPVSLGLSLAGVEIRPITPEGALFMGEAVVVPFETPGTRELAQRTVDALKTHQVAIMQNHGVVAIGRTILEALNRLEIMEFTARIMTITHIWGGTTTLSKEQLKRLGEKGQVRWTSKPSS